jgi:protein ImuB
VPIGLVAPSRAASHFTLLARERLGTMALAAPVRALALAADDIVPLNGEPLTLFADESGRPEDWQKLVERLRARLGTASVHGVCGAAEHRPEYASRACEPPLARGKETGEGSAVGLRPFWLLAAPRPIEEIGAVPHYGGPLQLVAGPERIESGWWDGNEVARDYFVAQTPEHGLVWIYRARSAAGGWFLHGLFA